MIYLAGGRSEDWRKAVAKAAKGIETFDPFKDARQGAIYEFTNDDLAAVSRSELVFCVVDYPVFTGAALEIGFAHALGIPVILVWQLEGRVDSMMAACATAVFTDLEGAISWTAGRSWFMP